MHDASIMRILERGGCLAQILVGLGQTQGPGGGQPRRMVEWCRSRFAGGQSCAPAQPVPQRTLRAILHDHIGAATSAHLLLAIAIERQDMQVVETGYGTRLLPETFGGLLLARRIKIISFVGAHDFDGYLLTNSPVFREVNCAHAAAAYRAYQGISSKSCADKDIHDATASRS